jgi:biotin synthase-related radical SAM superfamily protein
VRLYAIFCYVAALFYFGTAVRAMKMGSVAPMSGKTEIEHRRDDPASDYKRLLFARWLIGGGLAAMGVLVTVLAGRFEKLENSVSKK